jgi:sulfur carrier protein
MIVVNGDEVQAREGTRLIEALGRIGVKPHARGVAVAVDGEVVPRSRWQEVRLSEGARVEVVGAMQGG